MRDRISALERESKNFDVPILGSYFKTRSDNEIQLPVIPTECDYSKNYYVLHIELENKVTKEIVDFLDFPIMPQQIELTSEFMTTVTKTQGSTVVVSNNSYMPTIMTISGTFGNKNVVDVYKRIPITEMEKMITVNDLSYTDFDATTGQTNSLGGQMTGYTVLKYFDALLEKHRISDLYNLNIFNLTFDQQFTCVALKKDFNMAVDKNGLWFYSVTFQSVKDSTSSTNVKEDYELALSQRMEAKRQAVEEYNKNILLGVVNQYVKAIAIGSAMNFVTKSINTEAPKFVSSYKTVQSIL